MRDREAEVVLQPKVTLDDAVLSAYKTFRNGCNFCIERDAYGSYWLRTGCYLLVNLISGNDYLVFKWLRCKDGTERKQLDGVVLPETIVELLRRPPCTCCGGATFQLPKETK